jgi:hypothetical protein
MSIYSGVVQGGESLSAPKWINWAPVVVFGNGVTNPLDTNTAQSYTRIVGQQDLIVTNLSTGFTWGILNLQGGSNNLNNGYIGSFDPSANYVIADGPFNCTVTYITSPPPTDLRVNRWTVVTNAPDSRTYTIAYSPYTGVPPTITLNAGSTPLGTQQLQVKTKYVRFLQY